ncbi:hypothetical protein GEMRC1_013024 [Eukaryota sp. GEM-RC1]
MLDGINDTIDSLVAVHFPSELTSVFPTALDEQVQLSPSTQTSNTSTQQPLTPSSSNCNQIALQPPKRRRRADVKTRIRLTGDEKLYVWQFAHDSGLSETAMVSHLNSMYNISVSPRTVRRIRTAARPDSGPYKSSKSSDYPILEQILAKLVEELDGRIIITEWLLQSIGLRIADRIGLDSQFTASNGWLTRFKKRHNLSLKTIHGEEASVDLALHATRIIDIRMIINNFPIHNVFNMDETALFWKALPTKTISALTKLHGKKNFKNRVTLVLTVSAIGEKLDSWMIGQAKNPHHFKGKNIRDYLVYTNNAKGWMTKEIFYNYMYTLNKEMRSQGRRILLLVDNVPSHKIEDEFSNVRLEFLPPNTSSKLQPLDLGVIKAFKNYYKRGIVNYIFKQKGAMRDFTLYEAVELCKFAWDQVGAVSIINCWRKTTLIEKVKNG